MERLKVGQEILLYNIVNETESTKHYLGSKKQTFVEYKVGTEFLAYLLYPKTLRKVYVFHSAESPSGRYLQEVRPVARFTVRRLHNTDPITII